MQALLQLTSESNMIVYAEVAGKWYSSTSGLLERFQGNNVSRQSTKEEVKQRNANCERQRKCKTS